MWTDNFNRMRFSIAKMYACGSIPKPVKQEPISIALMVTKKLHTLVAVMNPQQRDCHSDFLGDTLGFQ